MKKHITGKWINDILDYKAEHALYREDGLQYHHLERFPGILFDLNGYVKINSREEYEHHPEFRITQVLTVKNGISKVKEYIEFTEEQKRILLIENITNDELIGEQATRKLREAEVLVRKRRFIERIKSKYTNTCQLCNTKLEIRDKVLYSEIHHIKPLGRPHNGPDITENMLCVCPNCHVKLDLGVIKLELKDLLVVKHPISAKYLSYHNNHIYNYKLDK
jgi:5-methylcytosine-specific restriction protein A